MPRVTSARSNFSPPPSDNGQRHTFMLSSAGLVSQRQRHQTRHLPQGFLAAAIGHGFGRLLENFVRRLGNGGEGKGADQNQRDKRGKKSVH